MALIKAGPLGSVSGRLGTTQFALTKNGCVASQPGRHALSQGRLAQTYRGLLAETARTWATPGMFLYREAWNRFAALHPEPNRLGNRRLLSGYNHWLRYCLTLYGYISPYSMPPNFARTDQISSISGTLTTAPSLDLTVLGTYTVYQTIEITSITRWAIPTRQNQRRNSVVTVHSPKYADSEDYSAVLVALNLIPVAGESWYLEIRWWTPGSLPTPVGSVVLTA